MPGPAWRIFSEIGNLFGTPLKFPKKIHTPLFLPRLDRKVVKNKKKQKIAIAFLAASRAAFREWS